MRFRGPKGLRDTYGEGQAWARASDAAESTARRDGASAPGMRQEQTITSPDERCRPPGGHPRWPDPPPPPPCPGACPGAKVDARRGRSRSLFRIGELAISPRESAYAFIRSS
jgi:hypothetical protein